MTGRLTDDHGHAWPITGSWCEVCGMPLILVAAGQAAHPCCLDLPLVETPPTPPAPPPYCAACGMTDPRHTGMCKAVAP